MKYGRVGNSEVILGPKNKERPVSQRGNSNLFHLVHIESDDPLNNN